jgi:beta-glucosidase
LSTPEFPPGFVWGAATAAYQIEGSAAVDGRTPSIWDTFSHTPGRTVGGDNGDVADDHYRLFRQDVALMADLGLTGYRFSISWSRVQPGGSGQANQRGLDFYRALVDELLVAGVQPFPTLYHWDLPQELEDAGGWPSRDTAERFADYAALVSDALGDRIPRWITVNEPWCAAFLGYGSGEHAPGRRDHRDAVAAAHHLLLAHGMAGERLPGEVGPAVNLYKVVPQTDDPADLDAARRIDGIQNRLFLDAVLLGRYPDDVLADLEPYGLAKLVRDGDMSLISGSHDLLGINYYTRYTVSGRSDGAGQAPSSPFAAASPWPGADHVTFPPGELPTTAMGWEIDPEGLKETLLRVATGYPRVPLYVTESGAAFEDVVAADGSVDDPERLTYLAEHLTACGEAIADGVPLRGYFAWSLLDNFEWSWGYGKRFGLVHVDFDTQLRTPKSSARWYGSAARRGQLPATGTMG